MVQLEPDLQHQYEPSNVTRVPGIAETHEPFDKVYPDEQVFILHEFDTEFADHVAVFHVLTFELLLQFALQLVLPVPLVVFP